MLAVPNYEALIISKWCKLIFSAGPGRAGHGVPRLGTAGHGMAGLGRDFLVVILVIILIIVILVVYSTVLQ
jgi:hypothetical protein